MTRIMIFIFIFIYLRSTRYKRCLKNSLQIVVLWTFLAVSSAPALGQDSEGSTLESPCPDVFTYLGLGSDSDRWNGVINVTTDQLPKWLTVFVELDEWDGPNWQLLTILDIPDNMTDENSKTQGNPGFTEMVYFSVQYDPQKITPRLKSISLDCKEICNVNKTSSAVMGTSSNSSSTTLRPVASWCNSSIIIDRFGTYFGTRAALKILQSPRSTNHKKR